MPQKNKYGSLADIFDNKLILALKAIALAVCADLTEMTNRKRVMFKKFATMRPEDECYDECLGYNCEGEIYIRLRNPKTKRYHPLPCLIDTTVHEVLHEVCARHGKRFWKLHKQCLSQILKELNIR